MGHYRQPNLLYRHGLITLLVEYFQLVVQLPMRFSLYIRVNMLSFLLGLNILLFVVPWVFAWWVSDRIPEAFGAILYLLGGLHISWLIVDGDLWRLLASAFLHKDWLHLIFNMMALHQLGSVVYSYYGGRQLLSFYVFTGIAGSLFSILLLSGAATVGASAAVFGLIGVLLAGSMRKQVYGLELPFRPWDVLPLALYTFLLGMQPDSNINNYAHLGGFLMGLILGYVFPHQLTTYRPAWQKRAEKGLYYLSVILLVGTYSWMFVRLPGMLEL